MSTSQNIESRLCNRHVNKDLIDCSILVFKNTKRIFMELDVNFIMKFETILSMILLIQIFVTGPWVKKYSYIVMCLYLFQVYIVSYMFQEYIPFLKSGISLSMKWLMGIHGLIGFYALIVIGMHTARFLGRRYHTSFFKENPKKSIQLIFIWLGAYLTGMVFYGFIHV